MRLNSFCEGVFVYALNEFIQLWPSPLFRLIDISFLYKIIHCINLESEKGMKDIDSIQFEGMRLESKLTISVKAAISYSSIVDSLILLMRIPYRISRWKGWANKPVRLSRELKASFDLLH